MDGSLVLLDLEYPTLACPLCGGSLYEFRQQVRCSNPRCPWLEGCCEGGACDSDPKGSESA